LSPSKKSNELSLTAKINQTNFHDGVNFNWLVVHVRSFALWPNVRVVLQVGHYRLDEVDLPGRRFAAHDNPCNLIKT
jgi:hypothetical protein